MTQTPASMESWLRKLLGVAPDAPKMELREYLDGIPQLETLADLPRGTVVLVRGDVDAKPGAKLGDGDVRLRSMEETLRFGRDKGWIQVIFVHIGRDPKGSLSKVRARIADILGCEAGFVADWLDPASTTILDDASRTIKSAAPGSVIVLENTRKYDVETVLWKTKPDGIPGVAPKLAKLANEFAEKIGRVYVNEAFSAGSLDSSTTVVPAAMDRVAMGKYVAGEFYGPVMECLNAQLVVSSGLKIDKLDDLEAMINRGKIRWVFTAGSLACGLKKAAAELDGGGFGIGVAEDPAHSDKPYFIPRARVEQAKKLIAEGRQKGIEFVMPADFVLQDERISATIGPGDQQFDVGPAAGDLFEKKIGEFIAAAKKSGQPAVAFHNGVFGMFEDPRFEAGTRRFMAQLKRMTEAGVKVYVGGGEGGKALEKYGQPDWVTHTFTAGGTVLNALGSEPVPYLAALRMARGCQT
jgi:phosphoglycerate kinase